MELASDRALSLVVKDEATVVAALLSTAVAAPVPDMTVMELRLVAVQPDNDDAAEVRCPPPPPFHPHMGHSCCSSSQPADHGHGLQSW